MRDKTSWLSTTFSLLDEMTARGNLIAGYQKSELQLLETGMRDLEKSSRGFRGEEAAELSNGEHAMASQVYGPSDGVHSGEDGRSSFDDYTSFGSEDWFNSEHLLSIAESFDTSQLGLWHTAGELGPLFPPM